MELALDCIAIVKNSSLWVWQTNLEQVGWRSFARAVKSHTCRIVIFLLEVEILTLMAAFSVQLSRKYSWNNSQQQLSSLQKCITTSQRFTDSKSLGNVALSSTSLFLEVSDSLRMIQMQMTISRSRQTLNSHSRTNLLCKWINSKRIISNSSSLRRVAEKTRKNNDLHIGYCTYYKSLYSIKKST